MTVETKEKVWLITGCSSGLGASIAIAVLDRGQKAIVTCRGDAESRLRDLTARGASALSLDVTDTPAKLAETVKKACAIYGHLDVLVNNAGYVLQGATEELTADDELAQYETNTFGVFKVTRAVLPYFRDQKSGVILNISSHVGRFARAAFSGYCGSKFAVEGFSEALSQEVDDLGIQVCCIEPGDFRTNVLGGNAIKLPAPDRRIPVYDHISDKIQKYNKLLNGKQRGDPDKAAEIIVKLANNDYGKGLPVRLALGSDAYENIVETYHENLKSANEWKDVSCSTDFDDFTPGPKHLD